MNKSTEELKKIEAGAPGGATYVARGNCYCAVDEKYDVDSANAYEDGYHYLTFINEESTKEGHYCLDHIREIIALRERVEKLEAENAELNNKIKWNHSVIDFIDFCINEEGFEQRQLELAFMHYVKSNKPKEQE